MTKALFGKQMREVFSWLYQNSKTGKRRSAKGIVGYALLYLFLFGYLCVIFGFAAKMLCAPMIGANMGWLYWCLMGLIAIFLGVFGSVFNTYSSLYVAKDNDLLLAMPIPASRILLVRLSGVYAMGLMYELIVMIPTIIIWFSAAPFSIAGAIPILLITLILSLLILVLSAILGWVVALVAAKLKHKNIITVGISLLFIMAYYYFYARTYSFLQELLLHLDAVGNTMKKAMHLLYHMGMAAEGNVPSMLIFAAIILGAFTITYLVLSRSFLRLTTAHHGGAKKAYKDKNIKVSSGNTALLRKEFLRFTSSANYMLNCGLGTILMPVSAGALIWKAGEFTVLIDGMGIRDIAPLLAIAVVCLLSSMNDMAAPSVSLEGKNLWIMQSLPVSGRQVLMAKLKLHMILTWIPAIPLMLVLLWLIRPNLLCAILMFAIPALFSLMMAAIELSMNLKMPNFHWTSETVPIKQSLPAAVALLGGWVVIAAFAALYVLLRNDISMVIFLLLPGVAFLAVCVWLLHWLLTRGVKAFETL